MPPVLLQPLKRALSRMNMHYFVPDNLDNCLSYSVVSYLKKLKNQAKVELEKMVASVGVVNTSVHAIPIKAGTKTSILARKDLGQLLEMCSGNLASLKTELTEFSTFSIHTPQSSLPAQPFK